MPRALQPCCPWFRSVNAVLAKHGAKPAVSLERHTFYAAAETAYTIVQTGERRFYGDIPLAELRLPTRKLRIKAKAAIKSSSLKGLQTNGTALNSGGIQRWLAIARQKNKWNFARRQDRAHRKAELPTKLHVQQGAVQRASLGELACYFQSAGGTDWLQTAVAQEIADDLGLKVIVFDDEDLRPVPRGVVTRALRQGARGRGRHP